MVARSSLKFTWLLPRFSELNFYPIIFITNYLARSFKKDDCDISSLYAEDNILKS